MLQKQGLGIGSGRDFISGLFQKQCGGTIDANFVARTRLPAAVYICSTKVCWEFDMLFATESQTP